jgi:putative membrane protein
MKTIALLFTLITALLHGGFLILEMFLWTKPIGLKIFHMSQEKANFSKVLAANQGLYNGMLALGLLLTFVIPDVTSAMAIRRYCLWFIVVVGCYGSYSLRSIKVLGIQVIPALIALIANEFT